MRSSIFLKLVAVTAFACLSASCGGAGASTAPLPVPGRTTTGPEVGAGVECIYPRCGTIPANNLHFFVQFTKRMALTDELFDFFAIEDDKGVEVNKPFLMDPLWSEGFSRLTLRIHPGRIKHDLRDARGMVFVPGYKFTLVVKPGLPSADGGKIEKEFRKTYNIGPEDRKPVLPQEWLCDPPRVATRNAMIVRFGEPMNVLMARSCLAVLGPKGERVNGEVAIGDNDDVWQFTPSQPWLDSDYRLQVAEQLEDLAGNRPGALFDKGPDDPPLAAKLERTFRPLP